MTVEAEARIVERDIRLLRDIEKHDGLRPHLHVQHVSTARAMALIREAKARRVARDVRGGAASLHADR